MSIQERVITEFQSHFGITPSAVVRAPGRVNLIGEHTDYNDGFVLPMAIDRAAWIALRPRDDRSVTAYSPHFNQTVTFSLNKLDTDTAKSGWVEYIRGTAWALQESGYELRAWDGVVIGDVPSGAGLSSSAALELATACAFAIASDFAWDAPKMAKLSQKAENKWVGVNCGIMDQMISASGVENHALLIDCRSLDTQLVPLPSNVSIVVLDTGTRRGLVDSAYNERRQSCEQAAARFGVKALRDVTLERFMVEANQLNEIIRKRARHVISENARTLQAVEAMYRGDASELGELMNASHTSLRDDFEVSSDALNMIVDCSRLEPTCYGARMTGAGFGGCAVALVDLNETQSFAKNVTERYQKMSNLDPAVYICRAVNGAEIMQRVVK